MIMCDFCDMEIIQIGELIKKVFDERGLSVSEFARRINKSRENVYDIFTRKTIDTGLLYTISEVLKFDFFKYYTQDESKGQEIKKLTEEVKFLKEVIEVLKKKIK